MFKEKQLVYFSEDLPQDVQSEILYEGPANDFELTVTPEAEVLMKKWQMEIRNNAIFVNGKRDTACQDVMRMDISVDKGCLVIKEQNNLVRGMVFEYRGGTPKDLLDHMNYVGINLMIDSGKAEAEGVLPHCQLELARIKLRHPKW